MAESDLCACCGHSVFGSQQSPRIRLLVCAPAGCLPAEVSRTIADTHRHADAHTPLPFAKLLSHTKTCARSRPAVLRPTNKMGPEWRVKDTVSARLCATVVCVFVCVRSPPLVRQSQATRGNQGSVHSIMKLCILQPRGLKEVSVAAFSRGRQYKVMPHMLFEACRGVGSSSPLEQHQGKQSCWGCSKNAPKV